LNLNTKIKIIKKILFLFYIVLYLSSVIYAQDDIYLSLSVSDKRSNIAIENFNAISENDNIIKITKILQTIIEDDLVFSKYFNITQSVYENFSVSFEEKLVFLNNKGISALITAEVIDSNGNNLILDIKMFDVITGEIIWKHKYERKLENYRYMAHEASDEIVKKFTGEIGIARSKVAFVNDSTGFKEIYIVDYDGYNLCKLTKNKKINILPKWSPNGEQIIYTSYIYNNPDLFVLNIVKNKCDIVSKYQGLNVTGSFSPDGKKILLTLSRDKYPNLYLINMSGEIIHRMTNNSCIDTSPSFAPNGREVVFISDRPGYPQLYIMNIEGGNVKRIITNGPCDSPSWSPCGDKIVFTMRQSGGNYDLCIYDISTSKIMKLTNNQKNNENPSWSPDGRFIVFCSNRLGKGEIYIMAIDCSVIRKLTEISGTSYTPSWSPVLIE
jgi:TolB protein